jgi:hypothetical protein
MTWEAKQGDAVTRAREGTVKNLQELYTVAVGVALAAAIEQVVRLRDAAPARIHWETLPAFFAFLVTLVPFYHGALRHLDKRHIEERGDGLRDGALLADFLLLFLEAYLLLVIARVLAEPRAVATGMAALLLLDSLWGAAMHRFFVVAHRTWTELTWVRINVVAGGLLAAGLGITSGLTPGSSDRAFAWVLPIGAAIRAAIDYWLSWDFYFPWQPKQRGRR